jgi:hypothetical protein
MGEDSVIPTKKAITMLVSSRNLPLAGIDPLAFLFDHLGHFTRGGVVQRSPELV